MTEISMRAAVINEPSTTKQQGNRNAAARKAAYLVVSLLALGGSGALALRTLTKRDHEDRPSAPTVEVAKAVRQDLVDDLILSAEFHPFQEVSLHAKVSGYVKTISVDIGDHVKEGKVIAELEVPELRDELKKGSAAVQRKEEEAKRAEANYMEAHLQYQRLQAVAKERPNLVAQQEIDNARAKDNSLAGDLGAARRSVEESQAEVSRMRAMLAYTAITAPFDGVITKRYADIGALIQAGISSNTQAMPLVDLAQDNLLRLVFPAPESVAPLIRVGAPVNFFVRTLDDKSQGTITRFSGKMDRATRTMSTEVDVPNPDGRFKPGMYASVRLIRHESKEAIVVPIRAIVAGETPTVFVLNDASSVESRVVSVGLETQELAEIKSGLKAGELVLVGRRSGVRPGQKVDAKLMEPAKND